MADIDSLAIKISTESSEAVTGIKDLVSSLTGLSRALGEITGIGKIKELATALNELSKSSARTSATATRIMDLACSLESLGASASATAGVATILNNVGEGLNNISSVALSKNTTEGIAKLGASMSNLSTSLEGVNDDKILALSYIGDSLKSFTGIKKPNLEGVSTTIQQLVDSVKNVDESDVEKISKFADAFKGLSQVKDLKNVVQGIKEIENNKGFANTFKQAISNIQKYYNEIKRVIQGMDSLISKSTEYGETINLFNESMKPYSQEAFEIAKKYTDALGLDVSDWMEYQGVFMSLANGFGVASDRAYTMSQQLTQLTYDLSSFFNTDVDTMAQKIQSAFAGELEPVRRLGYDLSQARLKAVALEQGITKSFDAMTQNEKAQLRYYTLMTQLTYVQGDLGKTLTSSANQIRVFKTQIELLGRSIGNIFIPILNQVLPYIVGIVKAIRTLADSIASLLGFKLPTVTDWGTSTQTSIEGVGDEMDNATGSAKALKKQLAGFDEINNLTTNDSSSGGSLGDVGGWSDFELPTYDFLKFFDEKSNNIAKKLKDTLKYIKGIGAILATVGGLALFKKIQQLGGITSALGKLMDKIKDTKFMKALNGISGFLTLAAGLTFSFTAGFSFSNGNNLKGAFFSALGTALTSLGIGVAFGLGAIPSLAIGVGLSFIVGAIGFSISEGNKISDKVKEIMYNGKGAITISDVALNFENVTTSITAGYSELEDNNKALSELKNTIMGTYQEIDKIEFAIKSGQMTAEEAIPKLEQLFAELNQQTTEELDQIGYNIKYAFTTVMEEALQEAGYNVNSMVDMISDLTGKTKDEVTKLQEELSNLEQQYQNGDITEGEYLTQREQHYSRINELLGLSNDYAEEFATSLRGIDFEDEEAVAKALENINTQAVDAKEGINSMFDDLDSQLNQFYKIAKEQYGEDSEQAINILGALKISEEQRNTAITEIGNALDQVAAQIETGLSAKADEVKAQAEKDWNDLSFLQKVWYGNDANRYVSSCVSNWKNNVASPIEDKLTASFKNIGEDCSTGLYNGAKMDLQNKVLEWQLLAAGVEDIFRTKLDTHSPSKVFEAIGIDLSDGLKLGIGTGLDGLASLATDCIKPFKEINTQLKPIEQNIANGVGKMISAILTGFNTMIYRLNSINVKVPDWVPMYGGKSWHMYLSGLSTYVPIPQLAKGGVVDQPTLAEIGEAGKEVVLPLEGNNASWMNTLANKVAVQSDSMNSKDTNAILSNIYALLTNMELSPEVNVTDVVDAINKQSRIKGRSVLV